MLKKKKISEKEKAALEHPDKFGAGAKKRRSEHLNPKEKASTVMREFYRGTLYSGSGHKVPPDRPDIAKAIAMSESGQSRKKAAGRS
jgi:hypothetical protein